MSDKQNILLTSNFTDALDQACINNTQLQKVRAKMRALLEDYAITRGSTINKLRLLDLCTSEGKLRPDLERHIRQIYPLGAKSRPSYVSGARRLVNAATKSADGSDIRSKNLIDNQIPSPMKKMLPFISRQGTIGVLRNQSKRPQQPYSRNGLYFLLAALYVWKEFQLTSLESLFRERRESFYLAIRKIAKQDALAVFSLVKIVRDKLKIPILKKQQRSVPVEQMYEPFRTEILNYRSLALTLGDEKTPEERQKDKQLTNKAARYGISLTKNRKITVKSDVKLLCLMYGHILPALKAKGIVNFSVKDLLRTTRMTVEEDGEKVKKLINKLLDIFRQFELKRSNKFKREGFDSGAFKNCVSAIKQVAMFNGYFSNLKDFHEAYKDVVLDEWTTENRKEIKKTIFSIEYVDGQLSRLRERYEKIIRTKSFVRRPDRSVSESNRDLALCFFYVATVVMRYLSYRQQCLRDCVYGENIIFADGGSITLYWPKAKVKNKTAIKVTLTTDMFDGAWEPVIHALQTYRDTVYPYALRLADSQGTLSSLGGQFFLHMNHVCEIIAWKPLEGSNFRTWFRGTSDRYFILPDAAIEADVHLHPHFLRGLCMDWMHANGMSDEDIATSCGITPEMVRRRYLNRNAVRDATRVLTKTDRRLKEEKGERTRLSYETEIAHLRKEVELVHKENANLRAELAAKSSS
jgi:ribosomal protein S3AE